MRHCDLLIRNVRPMGGAMTDVAVRDGAIAGLGEGWKGPELDGGGGTLIPGLIDHHIHLFATAAQRESVDLHSADDPGGLLAAAARNREPGSWLRATGLDGAHDRTRLDQWVPEHPLRVQDRTGALWMLNSLAMARLGPGPFPDFVEAERGHIWRGDAWLRDKLGHQPPSLETLGAELARHGVTGVTDAGANNGPVEARLLAAAGLPQRLMLMGLEDLQPLPGTRIGPVKLLYDESANADPEDIARRIRIARSQNRTVAAHCVTLAELLVYLAALDLAGGQQPGDRIEHGSVIPASLIPEIAARGLTVVTQPGFVTARGDQYLEKIAREEQPDLYRLASLNAAGIGIAAGSDAPYGPLDPWECMAAAIKRQTASGRTLGPEEALQPINALALYLGSFEVPGNMRSIKKGAVADLCLLSGPLHVCVNEPDSARVTATIIGGALAFHT